MLTDMLILKNSNCDVLFLRNAETAILGQKKTEEKQNNNSCSENNYEKITTNRTGNCQNLLRVVRIVRLQSLPSNSHDRGRVLGRRVQPSGKNRSAISLILESGGVSGSSPGTIICKRLASWSCAELNLINIPIHFQRMRS